MGLSPLEGAASGADVIETFGGDVPADHGEAAQPDNASPANAAAINRINGNFEHIVSGRSAAANGCPPNMRVWIVMRTPCRCKGETGRFCLPHERTQLDGHRRTLSNRPIPIASAGGEWFTGGFCDWRYPPSDCCHVPTCRKLRFVPKTRRRHLPVLETAGNLRKIAGRPGRCPDGPFVFYEGPPTANGLPHPGHCLTRSIKDLFPRYKTMRGYLCRRKAGWDTHGLPVEVEVCKELGIHSKEEIEAFGVEPFIRKCVESVFRYTQQWEQLTERLGFWIHLDEAYVTFHQSYVESVWWALKTLFDRGLLYQGHKIVWWWAQGGTALSCRRSRPRLPRGGRSQRVCAVSRSCPLSLWERARVRALCDVDLLVWTTTPWTLPSNQFAAVKPDLEYSVVAVEGETRKLILASALVETVSAQGRQGVHASRRRLPGETTHRPALSAAVSILLRQRLWRARSRRRDRLEADGESDRETTSGIGESLPADFVTTDTGTGIVHQAPAFGEVDFDLLQNRAGAVRRRRRARA